MHVEQCQRRFLPHRLDGTTVGVCACGVVQVHYEDLLEMAIQTRRARKKRQELMRARSARILRRRRRRRVDPDGSTRLTRISA